MSEGAEHPDVWLSFRTSAMEQNVRLLGFFEEVRAGHKTRRDPITGKIFCSCKQLATFCPVTRAAVRHSLIPKGSIDWPVLPEDTEYIRSVLANRANAVPPPGIRDRIAPPGTTAQDDPER